MSVQFFESMSGELIDNTGTARHVAIDIKCQAAHVTGLVLNGVARVTGTIRAEPWTGGSACDGTVLIKPVFGRRIEYDIACTTQAGTHLRLHGRKDIRVGKPIASITAMPTTLSTEGRMLAEGTMQFHLDDIFSFLRSWSINPMPGNLTPRTATSIGLPTTPASSTGLTDRERRTMRALAEAIIVEGIAVAPPDDQTVREAENVLEFLPATIVAGYRASLQILDATCVARHGKRYADSTVTHRRDVLDFLERRTGIAGRTGVFAVGVPLRLAHFSRRDYLDRIGIPTYERMATRPAPRWTKSIVTPESLPTTSRVDCDVVVVGSGAGGAAAASALAEAGLAVVVVEEGRHHPREELSGPLESRMLNFWRDAGMTMTIGNSSVSVPTARMLGGTTAINSGTCFRTPATVLHEWRSNGFPSDFDHETFGRYLDAVDAELNVGEADPAHLGEIANVVARGAQAMGAHHGPLRRNAPGCDGQGVCITGCPTGAKRSTDVSWLPRAVTAGAAIYTGLAATRILFAGKRAAGVYLEGTDNVGAPHRVEVHSRATVIAAGTLQTPLLLRANGVDLPRLGHNLSIHPAFGALAMFDELSPAPWKAIPQGYFVEGLADERVRFEGYYLPPQLSAATLPMHGAELTRWMDNAARVSQFGFMIRDTGVGSVSRGPDGRPLLRYSLTPRVMRSLRLGSAALAELLLRGGSREVSLPIHGVDSMTTVSQSRALAHRKIHPRDVRLMGFHPLGTARMGTSPQTAVVDFEHRVFGYENLYVADGSCVPTSLGVNPQVTIMAMGLRAADVIASELG